MKIVIFLIDCDAKNVLTIKFCTSFLKKIFRWMAEGVLFKVYASPGIRRRELEAHYGFVLQPVHLHEILELLERIGTIRRQVTYVTSITKKGPFESKVFSFF